MKTMSVREAIAEAGFEAIGRADFGAGVAYYRARRLAAPERGLDADGAGEAGDEVLLRLVVGREMQAEMAAARLEHPNVLRCDGARHAPGFAALVFEPFRGRSLAREMERRAGTPLEPRRAVEVGVRIARALAHAHAAGLAHGAVSAENIALGPAGAVKLVGFGAAALRAAAGERAEPLAEGDVVALGATLLAAITPPAGRPAPDEVAILARVLERAARARPELGFYPDARALESALEAAGRRLGEARADMTGRFAAAELADLLQMVEASRRAGRLELASAEGGEAGAFAFREGRIVAARAGGETGREAVLRLLRIPAGRFRLWYGKPGEPPPEGAIAISAALLEASRLRDEEMLDEAAKRG